jgi:hypothetical protein
VIPWLNCRFSIHFVIAASWRDDTTSVAVLAIGKVNVNVDPIPNVLSIRSVDRLAT